MDGVLLQGEGKGAAPKVLEKEKHRTPISILTERKERAGEETAQSRFQGGERKEGSSSWTTGGKVGGGGRGGRRCGRLSQWRKTQPPELRKRQVNCGKGKSGSSIHTPKEKGGRPERWLGRSLSPQKGKGNSIGDPKRGGGKKKTTIGGGKKKRASQNHRQREGRTPARWLHEVNYLRKKKKDVSVQPKEGSPLIIAKRGEEKRPANNCKNRAVQVPRKKKEKKEKFDEQAHRRGPAQTKKKNFPGRRGRRGKKRRRKDIRSARPGGEKKS